MALGILAAGGVIPSARLEDTLVLGELSLLGDVRPVRGALAAAEAARAARRTTLLVAPENGPEAALVEGVEVRTVRTLADAVAFLSSGDTSRAPLVERSAAPSAARALIPDMRDVKGQGATRLAVEVAAAGGHNILLVGGPGSGKTMLARRLPGILPPLSPAEALEVTRVHSVAGLNIGGGLVTERPFRAPHHSTSPPGLVGGGTALPRPGELSLAHHGVLFLDDLAEFSRAALEVVPEPVRAGEAALIRASGTLRFPARCLVVASMLPCPCGHAPGPRCRCSDDAKARYRARVPERVLELFDLRVHVPLLDVQSAAAQPGPASAEVSARVAAARNASAPPLTDLSALTDFASRAHMDRALRVAHTLARLDGAGTVARHHVVAACAVSGPS
jgi:magnesium chelatase family protein